MTDKEIIIDGVIYNKCNGCSLYDGNICNGARTYEDNAERDRHSCDEHLASQFWVVFKQLKRKEQECEEFKKQHEQYKPFYELGAKCTQLNEVADGLSNKCDKYKQALDEIENYVRDNSDFDKSDKLTSNTGAYDILEIINEVKK